MVSLGKACGNREFCEDENLLTWQCDVTSSQYLLKRWHNTLYIKLWLEMGWGEGSDCLTQARYYDTQRGRKLRKTGSIFTVF